MFTVICITVLAYLIMGKDIDSLLQKVKDVNWSEKVSDIGGKLRPYALKAGRAAARPVLQFYYVLKDDRTSTLDRVLIYAAIVYTISPASLIPASVYRLLGVLDEGAAIMFVYRKIKEKITPDIIYRTDTTLDEWFGVEYEVIDR